MIGIKGNFFKLIISSKKPILNIPVMNIANNKVISMGNKSSNSLVISITIINELKVLVMDEIKALAPQSAKIVTLVLKWKIRCRISPKSLPIKQPSTKPGVKIPKGMAAVVKKKIIKNLAIML